MEATIRMPRTKVTQQVTMTVPMPLETASLVEWEVRHGPYKGTRGHMGQLLDEYKMDLGDLGYIIDHWRDPHTKAAALTLLAHRLGQPQTAETALRFGPEVINGSNYLEDQEWDSEMQAVVYLSVGVTVAMATVVNVLSRAGERIIGGSSWLVTVIALMIALPALLIPLAVYIWWQIRRQVYTARAYRLGREGEEWVADKLRALLDSRWVTFHNVSLPRRRGDIDYILVGPAGVWVLEVKAFDTDVRVRNRVWEWQAGKRWSKLGSDPVAQVRSNAMNLRDFLDHHGVELRVNAAVILTQPQRVTSFEPTAEPVWKQFEVDDRLSEMNKLPECLSEKERARIVSALKEVIAKSKK